MRIALLIAMLSIGAAGCAAGCATYTQSKIDLAEQARRGVRMARDAAERREQQIGALDARQRTRIDEAFDADVTVRPGLTADWVIDHRRAYAVALDALRGQRIDAERARQRTFDTLDAVDAALVQLQRMHASELKLSIPELKLSIPEVGQ